MLSPPNATSNQAMLTSPCFQPSQSHQSHTSDQSNYATHVDTFKLSLPLRSIQSNLQLLSSTLTNLTSCTQAHPRLHAALHTLTLTTTRLINATTQVLTAFARSSAQCLDAHDLAQDLLHDGLPQLAATHLSSSIPTHTANLPARARKLSDAFASAAAAAAQTTALAERVRAHQISRRDSLCEAVADEHARIQKAKVDMEEHSNRAQEARNMYSVAESYERIARSRRDVLNGVRVASTIGSMCVTQSHPTVAALAAVGATATASLVASAEKDIARAREERAVQLHRADCCDVRCVAARSVAAEASERLRHVRREETLAENAVDDIRKVESALRSLAATMIAAETFWKGLVNDHDISPRCSYADARAAVTLIECAARKSHHQRAVFVHSDRFEAVWRKATAWWTAVSAVCDDAVASVADVRRGNYRLVVGEEGEDDSDGSNTCLDSLQCVPQSCERQQLRRFNSSLVDTETRTLSRKNTVDCSEVSEDDDYRFSTIFRTFTGVSVHSSTRPALNDDVRVQMNQVGRC